MVAKVVIAYSELGHTLERHTADKALDSKKGEAVLAETWHAVSTGFPLYGLPVIVAVLAGVVIVALVIGYVLTAKGVGSHAGKEQIRRTYRKELAKQMARQDAEKIKAGEKPRRKYMQW